MCTPSVDAHRNTCSRIYGALCRAAAALGYLRAVTYTLEGEAASSVRGAGFEPDGLVPARVSLETGARARFHEQVTFFPETERRPRGAKIRWVRWLRRWHPETGSDG